MLLILRLPLLLHSTLRLNIKTLNTTITTYTFPALTAQEYFLTFVVDGTTIEWVIGDIQLTKVSARLQRAATQSIATGATGSPISFDVENLDTGGIWDAGAPTRITIPGTGSKRALITGYAIYAGIASAVGSRRIIGYLNGSTTSATMGAFIEILPASSVQTFIPISFQIDVSGGDYIELQATQTQLASLNVTCVAHITIENR